MSRERARGPRAHDQITGARPVGDLRGESRRDRQEGAEVEVAFAAGEVAQAAHVDERMSSPQRRATCATAPPSISTACAWNAARSRSRKRVGIDEGVARQDAAEMHGGHAPTDADRFRQRLQNEPLHGGAQARHHRVGHRIARLPFLSLGRPAARLDGVKTCFAVHAEIVLRIAGADHDVAHAQRRVEAARHAAHQERTAVEAIQQQRRGHAGIDLAGARSRRIPPRGRRSRCARTRSRRFPAPGPNGR